MIAPLPGLLPSADAISFLTLQSRILAENSQSISGQRVKDKYQFQWWAVSLVKAVPYGGKKKSADSGIDGLIYFKTDARATEKAIVSVKGGDNVTVAMVRDLAHVVQREKAKMGIFITLAEPTRPMLVEAVKEQFYEVSYLGGDKTVKFPKIQILTIEQLLPGIQPQVPLISVEESGLKKSKREAQQVEQEELPF